MNRFVIALNAGTMGLFWWSFPTHVSRYYDHIIDLENKGTVEADCDPPFKLNWGARRSLKKEDLERCGLVLSYLFMMDDKGLATVHHYMRALTAMVKTDIFLQIQANAVSMFYDALQRMMLYHSDWDGTGTFRVALDNVMHDFINGNPGVAQAIGLAESLTSAQNVKVNLNDALTLKWVCDFYILKKAIEFVNQKRKAQNASAD